MSRVRFLIHLLNHKPAPPSTIRFDVCPPEIGVPRESIWTLALRWLVGNNTCCTATSLRPPLERARDEFVAAMEGLVNLESNDLLQRAQHARSMRELWHLRSELYTLIARRMNQQEADARIAQVNQHFPTRAQRTGINATESADV